MELETLGDKVSDIHDAMGRIETKLEELDDRISDVEHQDSEVKNIEGYCSSINSNIDQLKD